jgi:hypothetical protein
MADIDNASDPTHMEDICPRKEVGIVAYDEITDYEVVGHRSAFLG